jgi:osmoprotectant transport system ATP-binding protein
LSGPTLRAEGVVKRFGAVTALAGVTLEARAGELLALVGESGSGKTTLLRCFNRLIDPDAGRLLVADRDVATIDPIVLRRGMGYVPQNGGLLPHWRVARNVALVPRLLGRNDADAAAGAALRLVGLDPETFGHRWPRELSGGQRQRVAIARALAAHPQAMLLDEPFGALDAITRSELQDVFASLRRRDGVGAGVTQDATGGRGGAGITCVLVTHDLREAFLLADRVAVLWRGRLEQVAPPHVLRDQPATEYVRALLARAHLTDPASPAGVPR